MRQDEIDTGERPGLSTDERRELTELRRAERRLELEDEILERAAANFARENVLPNVLPVVRELADDGVPVATACRVVSVSTSGYYDWRDRATSARRQADLQLVEIISDTHARSRQTYGSPRIHAELRLGRDLRVGRTRFELMREHSIVAVHRRRRGCTRRDPAADPAPDLVNREFVADRPDALWVSDITQHHTNEGWVYCSVVLDTFSRRVIGWSIADHLRTELVVDALEMACLRRSTHATSVGTIFHPDHGSQYTSWAFGQRLRHAGLLGSTGTIGDCFDNALAETFFSSMQVELLDRRRWCTRQELANAIFEWIEALCNPIRPLRTGLPLTHRLRTSPHPGR